MLADARTVPDGTVVEADLCVVGAGPAGISLAREFIGRGRRVVVLESGKLERDPAIDALSAGRVAGRPYPPLESTRDRVLGGTSASWAGECRPLDTEDFRRHDAIPDSGWPFGRDQLSAYYERARQPFGVGPLSFDAGHGSTGAPHRLALKVAGVRMAAFHVDSPTHFGVAFRRELEEATDVTVYLGATVGEIEASAPLGRVTALRIVRPPGEGFRVAARLFVLAAGGIENARLLLLSDRVARNGLGNGSDLVGRYFMEHLYLDDAALLRAPVRSNSTFHARGHDVGGHRVRDILTLEPEVRRREGITNYCAVVTPSATESDVLAMRYILFELAKGRVPIAAVSRLRGAMVRLLHEGATKLRHATNDSAGTTPASRFMALKSVAEQAPNPDSRIVLTTELDPLGCRRVELRWRLSPIDKRTAHRAHEILATAFRRAGFGFTSLLGREDDPWPARLRGACHHMGTTRMSADPRRGVVDADCQVHGIENLYVAGSSVFPTCGAANPTFTIVALAIRLADRLHKRLG